MLKIQLDGNFAKPKELTWIFEGGGGRHSADTTKLAGGVQKVRDLILRYSLLRIAKKTRIITTT